MKPLFIPLKGEFFDAFADGSKTTEWRRYGRRWNELTCPVGRPVVISRGYGKARRLTGEVASFKADMDPTLTDAWRKCYGERRDGDMAACITIRLTATDRGGV